MQGKTIVFLVFVILSIGLVAAAGMLPSREIIPPIKLIIFIIGLGFDILAILSRNYSDFVVKIISQRSKNVVLNNEVPYSMSTNKDSIIVKNGVNYAATVYIKIPVYKSSSEMKQDEKIDFSRMVGRMVGQSKDTARYTTGLFVMNKDLYIQQLRDNITDAENNESSLEQSGASKADIERARGKLAMWRNILDSVNSRISFDQISYISITSKGSNEFEAVGIAQEKAREFISGIGTVFGVSPSMITGTELLRFIEPEFQLPYSTMAESITKSVEEEVI